MSRVVRHAVEEAAAPAPNRGCKTRAKLAVAVQAGVKALPFAPERHVASNMVRNGGNQSAAVMFMWFRPQLKLLVVATV